VVVLDKAFSVFRRPFLMPSESASFNKVKSWNVTVNQTTSTKLKIKTASRQSNNRVRAYRTHPTRWFWSSA